jgi:hypothetical protein
MRIVNGKLGSSSAMSTEFAGEPRLAAEGFLGVQRGVFGGSVAFVAPDDSLAWLDEDDAFTQTGDNLLKLMTVARLTKISDHRIGSSRC